MNLNIGQLKSFFWLGITIITLIYSVWYTLSGYDNLVSWYQNVHPHFYKDDVWLKDFFTKETYTFGIWYHWLLFSVLLLLTIKNKQLKFSLPASEFESQSAFTKNGVIIFFLSLVTWWFWQSKADYATDEVFSAVQFAGKPLFLIISHYPLPNNHIFFNVINHFLSLVTDDLVFSGRWISGVALGLTMMSVYAFSHLFVKDTLIRLCIILLLMTVFPIFGFATQARGYGIYMLFSWLAFAHLYYYTKFKAVSHLRMYAVTTVLGLWTLPSFLYLWIGISLGYMIWMWHTKYVDKTFIVASIKIFLLMLFVYMPTITFSGWKAIFANKYVSVGETSYSDFIYKLLSENYFLGLFNEWFGTGEYSWIAILILLIPYIIYLLSRQKSLFPFILYTISLGFTLLVMIILMKKYPFYRNLVGHSLLFWVFFLLITGHYIESIKPRMKYHFIVILLLICSYFSFLNFQRYPFNLYYYDVNAWNQPMNDYDFKDWENQIVFIHDESFYWQPAISKVTSEITLGGKLKSDVDIIVIDSLRSVSINKDSWERMDRVGETEFWIKK